MTTNLSELFPGSTTVELLHGKKAIIGKFTLEHIAWAEKRYGGYEAFQKIVLSALERKSVADLAEIAFVALENRDDFESSDHFARHVHVMQVPKIRDAVERSMQESFPDETPKANEGDSPEGKRGNPTGETTSAQSRVTTRTKSKKSSD